MSVTGSFLQLPGVALILGALPTMPNFVDHRWVLNHDGAVREVEWDAAAEWFDPLDNGSAPDIAIEGTTLADWQALITLIRTDGWHAEHQVGDDRVEVPTSAADLFVPHPDGLLRSLWVWPRPYIELIFRVQTPDAIVGDADLHQLQGQQRLDDFCGVLRRLGRELSKRVAMYAEGSSDQYPPILAYEAGPHRPHTDAPDTPVVRGPPARRFRAVDQDPRRIRLPLSAAPLCEPLVSLARFTAPHSPAALSRWRFVQT